MRQFVLIGGGHTSASAARALRKQGFDGKIVIVGDEVHAPYQRPPLSKDYLSGSAEDDEIWSVSPDWYAENNVELRLGIPAKRIDVETLGVELADGSTLVADAVLIATGVSPRRLPGVTSSAVHYLKTLDDAQAIKAKLREGLRVVIVGAGFIGLEIAAAARSAGADVTVLEAAETPLEHILGKDIGDIVARIHKDQGVDIRCGVMVDAIEDTTTGVVVRTKDGTTLEGDMVVVGIGVTPNDQIARASEITVGNGIRVDEFCRTSAVGVYAAGDIANHAHPIAGRVRVEHFDNATRQAQAAAANMLGIRTEYTDVHWFWSDQYDHNLQFAGHAAKWDEIVFRGDVEGRDFSAFYLKDGHVVAVFGLDRGGDVMHAKTLIADKRSVDRALLADDDTEMTEIIFGKEEPDEDDTAPTEASPDDFQRVARSGQVTEGMVRRFSVEGTEIAVARASGKVYALHNLCTHLACHLASGKVEGKGLTCLCHGSIFELETGVPINPPATRPVRTYPTLEKDGQIYVKVS